MLSAQDKQQGFGLIEMLVASFVITFGLMGMVLMQGHTQRDAFNAHRLSLAGLYAQDLQERLRANMCYINASGTNTSDLDDFLNDTDGLKETWEDDHDLAAKDWDLDQVTLKRSKKESNNAEQWDETEASNKGYWRFDLELCYDRCSEANKDDREIMTQNLLVEHTGGCS